MRRTKALALTSVLFLASASAAFAEGAATPTGQGADINVSQTHNGADVSISGSAGSAGTSGSGTVASGKANVDSVGPRSH